VITGELLPGAIELPSNGSKWELQDISVLQGQEPQDSESEIDNSPPSKDASKASESAEVPKPQTLNPLLRYLNLKLLRCLNLKP
jgi:hypothetical protein